MDDQLKYLLENCKKSMEASVTHLENELLNILNPIIKIPLNISASKFLLNPSILLLKKWLTKLNKIVIKNRIIAIPNTYIEMNLNVEEMEETCPVIITTANEEAHGNKPVINPTMIGLSSFVSLNLPCKCP